MTLSKRNSSISVRSSGVSFLEFVIAIPIIVFVVLGLIDFSIYLSRRGLLENGAQEAIALASVIPNLDDQLTIDTQTNETLSQEAIAKVQEKALSRFGAIWGDSNQIEFKFAFPTQEGAALKQVLTQKPMVVTLTATYDPILPFFSPITMKAEARGYREVRTATSMPVAVDCAGVVGGTNYSNCDCPADDKDMKVWDSAKNRCVCKEGLIETKNLDAFECSCPENMEWISAEQKCLCSTACNEGEERGSNCACICKTNYTPKDDGLGCRCSSPWALVNGECVCQITCVEGTSDTDPNRQVLDPQTCSCNCVNSSRTYCQGACKEKCLDLEGRPTIPRNKINCNCLCPEGSEQCAVNNVYGCYNTDCSRNVGAGKNGKTKWDSSTCTCVCPEGYEECKGSCYPTAECTNPKQWLPEVSGNSCSCRCPDNYSECTPTGSTQASCYPTCGSNQEFNETCGCRCKATTGGGANIPVEQCSADPLVCTPVCQWAGQTREENCQGNCYCQDSGKVLCKNKNSPGSSCQVPTGCPNGIFDPDTYVVDTDSCTCKSCVQTACADPNAERVVGGGCQCICKPGYERLEGYEWCQVDCDIIPNRAPPGVNEDSWGLLGANLGCGCLGGKILCTNNNHNRCVKLCNGANKDACNECNCMQNLCQPGSYSHVEEDPVTHDCNCVCDTGYERCGNRCVPRCTVNGQTWDGSCQCRCPVAGQVICEDRNSTNYNKCISNPCPGQGKVWNPHTCSCDCPPNPANGTYTGTDCSLSCNSGYTLCSYSGGEKRCVALCSVSGADPCNECTCPAAMPLTCTPPGGSKQCHAACAAVNGVPRTLKSDCSCECQGTKPAGTMFNENCELVCADSSQTRCSPNGPCGGLCSQEQENGIPLYRRTGECQCVCNTADATNTQNVLGTCSQAGRVRLTSGNCACVCGKDNAGNQLVECYPNGPCAPKCPAGFVRKPNSCECVCDAQNGYQQCNATNPVSCVYAECAGDQYFDAASSCKCKCMDPKAVVCKGSCKDQTACDGWQNVMFDAETTCDYLCVPNEQGTTMRYQNNKCDCRPAIPGWCYTAADDYICDYNTTKGLYEKVEAE